MSAFDSQTIKRKVVISKLLGLMTLAFMVGCQQQSSVESDSNASPNAADPTQTITHAMGSTEVPILRSPRVVTIDTGPLDAALALDIDPVGTIRYGSPTAYLGQRAENIPVIGQYNQPSIEGILRLNPHLILGSKSISASIYPQLLAIAPTVFVEGAGFDWKWKDNFKLFAQALGLSEKAEQLLSDYEMNVSTLKQSLNAELKDIKVSILVLTEEGIIAQTPRSFSCSILKEFGFSRICIQRNEDQVFVQISREDIESPDGDVIFLIYSPHWDAGSAEELTNDPLLSNLNAVKNGLVCEVAGDVWSAGRGILAAQTILDDVDKCFEK